MASQAKTATPKSENSGIVSASVQMTLVSLVLFFLPLLGQIIGGYVGGKNAGSVSRGLVAAILPGIIVAAVIFGASSTLAGLPVIGALAGAGAIVLAAVYALPVIGGAVVGGLLA